MEVVDATTGEPASTTSCRAKGRGVRVLGMNGVGSVLGDCCPHSSRSAVGVAGKDT
jgi:hypothetical protein